MSMSKWCKTGFGLVMALIAVLAAAPGWSAETSAVEIELVVKVNDRAQAADRLVAAARSRGGYFLQKARDAVILRVPSERVKPLVDDVGQVGQVVDRQLRRDDLGEALLRKEAALKAKTASQRQYLALIDQADTDAALYVERELTKLVAEIETLKGEIRRLRHRIALARVAVRFEYRDRSAPVPDGASSFAWLNTMNLTNLLEEF